MNPFLKKAWLMYVLADTPSRANKMKRKREVITSQFLTKWHIATSVPYSCFCCTKTRQILHSPAKFAVFLSCSTATKPPTK